MYGLHYTVGSVAILGTTSNLHILLAALVGHGDVLAKALSKLCNASFFGEDTAAMPPWHREDTQARASRTEKGWKWAARHAGLVRRYGNASSVSG